MEPPLLRLQWLTRWPLKTEVNPPIPLPFQRSEVGLEVTILWFPGRFPWQWPPTFFASQSTFINAIRHTLSFSTFRKYQIFWQLWARYYGLSTNIYEKFISTNEVSQCQVHLFGMERALLLKTVLGQLNFQIQEWSWTSTSQNILKIYSKNLDSDTRATIIIFLEGIIAGNFQEFGFGNEFSDMTQEKLCFIKI